MGQLYKKHDKIMLRETGEVLTVLEDLSDTMEPGIVVKEKKLRFKHADVRPAGRTRQRREAAAAIGITEPEAPPPPPVNRFHFEPAKISPRR
jgi:hypothetical protein